MYSNITLAKKYLHYYLTAANGKGHGMHSPFVFDFIRRVLSNGNGYAPPSTIEALRKTLLHDPRTITVEDMGAGSRNGGSKQKKVKDIARAALKPRKLAQLLFRLASHYRPRHIVELGTSLGLTTAYFSAAVPDAQVITIEGSAAVADIAQENFRQLDRHNIELHTGHFDQVLPGILERFPVIDMAYVDGNHRYAPTMDYFRQLLRAADENTILVFDDIHWSEEMERAWTEIRQHPEVTYTIDIFFLGFVFFRKDFKVKQDFMIRF